MFGQQGVEQITPRSPVTLNPVSHSSATFDCHSLVQLVQMQLEEQRLVLPRPRTPGDSVNLSLSLWR